MDSLNIQNGDILILHSSMDEMANIGVDAIGLIRYFLEKLGEEGTLVVPTFPLYPKDWSQPLVLINNGQFVGQDYFPICFFVIQV